MCSAFMGYLYCLHRECKFSGITGYLRSYATSTGIVRLFSPFHSDKHTASIAHDYRLKIGKIPLIPQSEIEGFERKSPFLIFFTFIGQRKVTLFVQKRKFAAFCSPRILYILNSMAGWTMSSSGWKVTSVPRSSDSPMLFTGYNDFSSFRILVPIFPSL